MAAFDPKRSFSRRLDADLGWTGAPPSDPGAFAGSRQSKGKLMNRRDAVLALLALGAAPHNAGAQQPAKIARVGYLGSGSASGTASWVEGFRVGLRELGYVEGKTIVIEWRFAEGTYERLPALVAELVRLKIDVLVAPGSPAISAARKATGTIPIVMAPSGDPIGAGFIASLARPGENITGLTN